MPKAVWTTWSSPKVRIRVLGVRTEDAVWFYPDPKPKAELVRDRVAFWKDVQVIA